MSSVFHLWIAAGIGGARRVLVRGTVPPLEGLMMAVGNVGWAKHGAWWHESAGESALPLTGKERAFKHKC